MLPKEHYYNIMDRDIAMHRRIIENYNDLERDCIQFTPNF